MCELSHFTTIKTIIKDRQCLIEALLNLNYIVKENVPILGYRGRKTQGDIVVKTGKQYDVGFNRNPEKIYQMVADWYGARGAIGQSESEFLSNITQEYSTLKVIRSVTNKGYKVQSRRITDTGEIQLVAVRREWK